MKIILGGQGGQGGQDSQCSQGVQCGHGGPGSPVGQVFSRWSGFQSKIFQAASGLCPQGLREACNL